MNHARPFGLAVILTVLIFSSSIHPARAASCPGLAAPAAIGTALTDVLYDPVAGVMKACVGGSWVSLGTGGGGGASALSGLSDVSVTGIGNGKSLVYNSTSSKWEPQTIGGGSSALATLTDVDTTGIADGKSLVYNATSSKWVPMTVSSGGSGTVSGTTGKIAKFTGAAAVGDSIMTESGGNIGIGASVPRAKLDVAGDIFTTGTYAQNSYYSGGWKYRAAGAASALFRPDHLWSGGVFGLAYAPAGTGDAALTWSPGITIDSDNGNVGIGTTNPTHLLDVSNLSGTAKLSVNASNSGYAILQMTDTSNKIWEISKRPTTDDGFQLNYFNGSSWNSQPAIAVSTTGYVGIGTTSPAVPLDVQGSSSSTAVDGFAHATARFYASGATGGVTIGSITGNTAYIGSGSGSANGLRFFTNGSQATPVLQLTNSGNVGIGTTSPGVKLDVVGTAAVDYLRVDPQDSTVEGGEIQLIGAGSNATMQIDNFNGNVRIHTLGAGKIFELVGGDAVKPGGGAWAASSDIRLKDVDGTYKQGLSSIIQLNTVLFHYKKGNPRNEPADRQFVGLIAQEAQKIFPEAVSTRDDGYLDLDATPINFALINAVKELKADNDNLRAELRETINSQDAEIQQLRQEIETLKSAR